MLQRDALDVVSDDVDLLWCVDQVVQLNDAWVEKSFEHSDLSLSCFALHRVCKLIFLILFQSVLPLITLIEAETDSRISALADDSSDVIAL